MTQEQQNAFEERIRRMHAHMAEYDHGKIGEPFLPEIAGHDLDRREITLRYHIQKWMMNCNGVMHGGVTATIMDNSMGWGACAIPIDGNITPTVSMSIDYLNAIPMCDELLVRVTVNAVKKKLVYVQAVLYTEDAPDIPLATSSGTYYRIPLTEHPWEPIA